MRHTLLSLVALISVLVSGTLAFGEKSEVEKPKAGKPDAAKSKAEGLALFQQQIQPVLVKQCFECHSKKGKEIEGGLELDSPAGIRRGGDSGPMLISHQVEKSPLIRMLRHDDDVSAMPPDDKLPDKVIAAFERWIQLGAPDSREDVGPTTKEERYEAGKRHWAFQLPQPAKAPTVKKTDWARDEIDHYVLARMEAEGIRPVADANRRTLVRRVYFDLVGLPPTPEQIAAFIGDDSPDALARLVDRLLASEQFGERWGRHWLDVVRYAESSGMEFNFTYPHAWPYRNYVIDAMNQDKPYDVFLREQIAGDLIPATEGESPQAVEARRIAPSLLAFGPKRHNSSGTGFRMDIVDDQINTVFRATLAMTVSCARCHDHKFDPIPTKDYYALAGIFLSTEPLYGTIKQKYSNSPTDLLPIGPNASALHAAAEAHEKKIPVAEKQLTAKRESLKKATAAEKLAIAAKSAVEKRAKAELVAAKGQPEVGSTATDAAQAAVQQELAEAVVKLEAANKQAATLKSEVASLEKNVAELKKNRPPRPQYAMSVRDRAKPADTKVAVRGNIREPGEAAPRGFLSVVNMANPPRIDVKQSGRMALAQWITSPENPITARVMVNRIWHHLFGRGIVESVDNFGMIGKHPSHPQLLDSLALRFMEDGWSVKRMIRTIMLSRSYQLSSTRDAANMKTDPDNRLFWRATPRRLEAEAIRDAILAVSGQIDLKRPSGSTVTPLGDQLVRGIPTAKIQPPSNSRSVYLPVVRDYLPELFDLFDFPSPSLVTGGRSVTNVPSQALYLRNSSFVAEQSKHAAKRLLASKAATDDAGRADLAMRWAYGRDISDEERNGALKLVQQIRDANPKNADSDVDAWAAWFHTLFTTAEFRFLVDIKSGDAT
ncbi:MAG: DUF1553 domain-containing protein [Planctomycetaceae bacterium]|nr:DUF1553 domain-containing protein [Planctomycetaceae bacterium]